MPSRKGPRPIELHMAYMSHVWHMSGSVMLSHAPFQLIPYIQQEILKRQQSFMEGWQKYLNFDDINVSHRERDVFWQEGVVRCLYDKQATGQPVLLIPSLINKHDIMDLLPDLSFFEYLKSQGYAPYIIDWGEPDKTLKNYDFADYISQLIIPLAQKIGNKPIAMGYCMGGILLAATISAQSDLFKAVGFLGCPWDFHRDQEVTVAKARVFYETVRDIIETRGFLDIDLIQSFFASADPLLAAKKFSKFAQMEDDNPRTIEYVAVEDWINDGIILPKKVAKTCFEDFYQNNLLAKGRFEVEGQKVEPESWNIPSLVVNAKKDRLVPPVSSNALKDKLKDVTLIEQDTGHIGLMGSSRQAEMLWPQISSWMKSLEKQT